jgi:hypothetical protein
MRHKLLMMSAGRINNAEEIKRMETWIHRMIKERSGRRLTACAVIIGCIALLLFTQQRYIQNFISGPHNLSAADLDQIKDLSASPQYFARISGSKAIDTGLEKITVRTKHGVKKSESVDAKYYALVMGDKFLIYEGGYTAKTTVEGALEPMPAEVSQHLFSDKEMRDNRSRFYPFYLNSKDSFRSIGWFVIAALSCLLVILASIGIPAWLRLRNPDSHPLCKKVSSWGRPHLISAAAERQFNSPNAFKAGSWTVTKEFLIQSSFFSFDILRLDDLLWAYKKVTQRRINFIPAGKTYAAFLICSGGNAEIQGGEIAVDRILGLAAEAAPWAAFGFSEECQAYFNKSKAEFCAAIEARRQEHLNPSSDT